MAKNIDFSRKKPSTLKELHFNAVGVDYVALIEQKNKDISLKEAQISTLNSEIATLTAQSGAATTAAGTCSATYSLYKRAQECRDSYHAIRDTADSSIAAKRTLLNAANSLLSQMKVDLAKLVADKASEEKAIADKAVATELATKGFTTESVLQEAKDKGQAEINAKAILATAEASTSKSTKNFQRIIIITAILLIVTYGAFKFIGRNKAQ